jgi:hypothetical protein
VIIPCTSPYSSTTKTICALEARKVLEQLHPGERLGDEDRRLQVLVDGEGLALDRALQELLRGDDAEDVVEAAAADRIARSARRRR